MLINMVGVGRQEDYNVRRWSEVNIMEGGKDARRRYMKKAKPQCQHPSASASLICSLTSLVNLVGEEPQFSRFAETLAKVMHNAIYIDQVILLVCVR